MLLFSIYLGFADRAGPIAHFVDGLAAYFVEEIDFHAFALFAALDELEQRADAVKVGAQLLQLAVAVHVVLAVLAQLVPLLKTTTQ